MPQSVSLQPGAGGILADTFIEDANPSSAFGGLTTLFIGFDGGVLNRGLMRWDLRDYIPPGATILTATLTVRVVSPITGTPGGKFIQLVRVLTDFTDAGTWLSPWTAPGGDMDISPFASAAAPSVINTFVAFDVAAGLQTAVNNDGRIFRYALRSSSETLSYRLRLTTTEVGTAAFRPQLEFTYDPPPALPLRGTAHTLHPFRVRAKRPCAPRTVTAARTEVVVQEEEVWGTKAAGHEALGVEFQTESFRNPVAHSTGGYAAGERVERESFRGLTAPAGGVVGVLQPHGFWPLMARHTLGGTVETTATGGGLYQHVLTGSAVDPLPTGLTFEKRFSPRRSSDLLVLRYLGARPDELYLRVAPGQAVQARCTVLAAEEELDDAAEPAPVYAPDNDPYTSFLGVIKVDGERVATFTLFDLSIANSLESEAYEIQAGDLRADLMEGSRGLTGSLRAIFTQENWAFYERYLADNPAAINCRLTRIGADPTLSYHWEIDLPVVHLRGTPTPQVAGRGPLFIDFGYRALAGEDGADVAMTITNTDPVLSTAP